MAFNQFQHIHHGMNPYGMQMSPQSQPYFGPQTGGLTQEMPIHDMHDFCRKHHMHYVHIHTKKGELLDGIIDEIDNDGVTLIIPIGDMDREDDESVKHLGFTVDTDFMVQDSHTVIFQEDLDALEEYVIHSLIFRDLFPIFLLDDSQPPIRY